LCAAESKNDDRKADVSGKGETKISRLNAMGPEQAL